MIDRTKTVKYGTYNVKTLI